MADQRPEESPTPTEAMNDHSAPTPETTAAEGPPALAGSTALLRDEAAALWRAANKLAGYAYGGGGTARQADAASHAAMLRAITKSWTRP